MPHLRDRYALTLLLKKLRYSPVVAIQGVRQSGKSTLARELLPSALPDSVYRTFDSPSTLDSALDRPESFLANLTDYQTIILDEAQKAPRIFDAIKHQVDLNRQPGKYLLLGSTEFSKLMRIRESLTGRLSRLRLFPLLSGEAAKLPLKGGQPFFLHSPARLSRKNWLLYLQRGGMPAIFATRDESEFRGKTEDWLSLTLERDARQMPGRTVDSTKLRRLLREIVVHPEPEAGRMARSLRFSPATVKSLLEVLETLFVIHRVSPHPHGTGKPRFYVCDPGLAASLGAGFERQLETAFYTEVLAKLAYVGLESAVHFSYFGSPKGSFVHGVWEQDGEVSLLKLSPVETLDERELLILHTTGERLSQNARLKVRKTYFLNGTMHAEKEKGVSILPWECLG